MQSHIKCCLSVLSLNGSHINGGIFPGCVLAARHGDIAPCRHIQGSAGFDAQRHIRRNLEVRQFAVCIPLGFDIGSPHLHELLHFFNAVVACQISHGNRSGLIGKGAHATVGVQGDIFTQYIGRPIRLRTAATFRVHQLFADGVEHHVLGPFKGWISGLCCQVFISGICRQIISCVGILGILVRSRVLQICLSRRIIAVLSILLSTFCVCQISTVSSIRQLSAVLLGKCVVLCLVGKISFIFSRNIDFFHCRFLASIFSLPLRLGLTTICNIISCLHICLIVVPILLQPFDIGPLVGVLSVSILFAINQAGVNPAMHHIVHAVHRAGFIVSRKRVNEAAVSNGQRNIPFAGFNFAHTHIATDYLLGQIDAVLGTGVNQRTTPIRGIDKI